MLAGVAERDDVNTIHQSGGVDKRRFSVWDWLFITCGVCLTFAITLRMGAGRILWEDEVLGWMLLKDPSFHHMLFSWNHGADGGGFTFYLTGRIWFAIFGASAVSFRLYTSTCFASAFVLLWLAARRFYTPQTLACAFAVTWFLSPVLLPHMAEGRFYGLFLAATAACILTVLVAIEAAQPTWKLIALTFASNSLLVSSHILGITYSVCLLTVWIIIDRFRNVRNIPLYLSAMAAWLWLIPSRHAILASAAVGRPHFWTSQPNLSSFLLVYTGESLRTTYILVALIGALLLQMAWRKLHHSGTPYRADRLPIILIAAGLLLMPPLFFLIGTFGPIIFNERYLQPVEIGIAFAVAEGLTQLRWPRFASRPAGRVLFTVASVLLFVMVLQYDLVYLPAYVKQQFNYTTELTRSLPADIPVVCEDAFTFTELMHAQSRSRVNYIYLLDWANSVRESAPRLEVTQFHLMENWKKVGYFSDHIEYRDAFLARYHSFLVLHTAEHEPGSLSRQSSDSAREQLIGNKLTQRFSKDPRYSELPYGQQTMGDLREVETLVCDQSVDCPHVLARLKETSSDVASLLMGGGHVSHHRY